MTSGAEKERGKSGGPKIKENSLPLSVPLRLQVSSGSNWVLRKQSPEMRSGSLWVPGAPETALRAEDQAGPDRMAASE